MHIGELTGNQSLMELGLQVTTSLPPSIGTTTIKDIDQTGATRSNVDIVVLLRKLDLVEPLDTRFLRSRRTRIHVGTEHNALLGHKYELVP